MAASEHTAAVHTMQREHAGEKQEALAARELAQHENASERTLQQQLQQAVLDTVNSQHTYV